MKKSPVQKRGAIAMKSIAIFVMFAVLAAACAPATPSPTPTSPPPTDTPLPTATNTPEPTATPANTPKPTKTPRPTKTPTPEATDTPAPTNTPVNTATPRFTSTPRATNTPTQPPAPPLLAQVLETRGHVDNIGGALDRLYQGSRAEACGPLLSDYYAVVDSPVYDVAGQPGNVQSAYGLYREAIAIIADKISKIRDICESGGGSMGPLDFDISRIAINDASGRLGTAIGMLQP